ncbi:MAG: amidohydrolase [Actinomycetota bacterium]
MTATSPTTPSLDDWIAEHAEELIAFRRHLHAHPELSGEEHATTETIVERLQAAGLSPRVLASGTGAVCDIGEGSDRIALRADIDALAMDDLKDVTYRSRIPGRAHACGHDVHTTTVLGAALYLAHHPEIERPVRLIFQPAEERVPGGAISVIDDAGLDDVNEIVGLHCDPRLDVGHIGLRAGPLTSAADMTTICLRGPGGHTARPDETVDLIPVAAQLVQGLKERTLTHLDRPDELRMAFGAIRSGDAANVIPTSAVLKVSVRSRTAETWAQVPTAIAAAVDELVEGTGAVAEVEHTTGVPPVINDATVTERISGVAHRHLGADAVTAASHSWGGDDFAWYLREVPGTFVRLGTRNPEWTDPPLDLHVGNFDADERAIGVGIRLLVGAVMRG